MRLQAKRDRLSRCHRRTRNIKDGSEEDTRGGRLVPTNHCHRSTAIPRVHGILSIFHPKLFENHTTPLRSYKKGNHMALGRTTILSFRDTKNPHVLKTCTPPTKLY